MSLWTSTKKMSLGLVLGTGEEAVVLHAAVESKGRDMVLGHAVLVSL